MNLRLNHILMLCFLFVLRVQTAYAAGVVEITPIDFEWNATSVLDKFTDTLKYPEGILNRYEPVGAVITNKKVSSNSISFTATKTKLLISKSIQLNGILTSEVSKKSCSVGQVGYFLKMRFDGSDSLVTDNIEELKAVICLSPLSPDKVKGRIQSQIILGKNYSSLLGPKIVSLVKDQVPQILLALTEEIKSTNR